ncbi:MAG: hypothetical protein HC851_15185 [Acaryochloris sp. RU_4_1]|nr:hypothetical protein [Acaryochloris sp. RU_4_1]NJR56758.1 hypothetical protein [Acaryochloris sp. CRU_2_0]
MRFCYADPPYLGCGSKHYSQLHPQAADWDEPQTYRRLIDNLCDEFTDGWALSLHSPSLRTLLPMCPDDSRVMAWVKPFAVFKPNVSVAYAWEPVIVRGGRPRKRELPTIRDWVSACITLKKGCPGAKPEGFCFWLFEVLNLHPTDELVDLFPGSGSVSQAWERHRTQMRLPLRFLGE